MLDKTETFETQSINSLHHSDDMSKLHDLRDAAFSDLAFWSNPAWLDSNRCSMSATAVTQWVVHHRTLIAAKKVTIAQIIGGVRGVIPQSRLANYGDFRYDIDYEDMYLTNDELDVDWETAGIDVNQKTYKSDGCSSKILNTNTDTFAKGGTLSSAYITRNTQILAPENISLTEWLRKVKDILIAVRNITDQNILVDSKTEALMKICLRFLWSARINHDLIRHVNSDITFITDYDELLKKRVEKIELHSIPQPCTTGNTDVIGKMVDDYWLKLSSLGIRRLWKKNMRSYNQQNVEFAFMNESLPLVWINFLRRHKVCKDSPNENVDIPKDVAVDLLGSLLQTIDGASDISIPEQTVSKTFFIPKNSFPQAHGEWTRKLFPHSLEPNPLPDKETIASPNNLNAQLPSCAMMKSGINGSQNMSLPIRFFMTVPPPPLASPVILPPINPSYIYCQAQNAMAVLPPGSRIINQQVPFCTQTPALPMTYIPPPTYITTQTQPLNWNYVPPRQNAPLQTAVPCYSSRLNAPRENYYQHNSKDITCVQNSNIISETTDGSSVSSQKQTEDIQRSTKENMQVCTENSCPVSKTIVQTTNRVEFIVPIRTIQNAQNIARSCNIFQPVKYASTTSTSIHCMKPNHHLQTALSFQTRPFINYKLLAPGLRPPISPVNLVNSQLSFQSRFMGPGIEKDAKLLQDPPLMHHRIGENYVYENSHSILIQNLLLNRQEDCLHYADKVKKWLEIVNPYMGLGPNNNTDKLSDPSSHLDSTHLRQLNNFNRKKNSTSTFNNCQYELKHVVIDETKDFKNMINRASKDVDKNFMNRYNVIGNRKKPEEKIHAMKNLCLLRYLVKLKKSKDFKEKVELLRRSFEEIGLSESRKNHSKRSRSKNLQIKHFNRSKCLNAPTKSKKFSTNFKHSLENKPNNFDFSTETVFDKFQSTSLSENNCNFKILTRESHEFNSFPSKRVKLSPTLATYFDLDFEAHNRLNKAASDVNYYKKMVDDLFFSEQNLNWNVDSRDKNKHSCLEEQKINGWTHFKITVSTILKNVSYLLEK